MDKQLQALLQISAKLYDKLTTVPEDDVRNGFIEEIEATLDERGILTQQLSDAGFAYDETNKLHRTLFELDKGIRERLERVLQSVKQDMKDLQATKKSEQPYMNPYGHVQTMDGMYYDKKK
ncbi:MAG: flagellar protein FliT [Solibacillus sp.]